MKLPAVFVALLMASSLFAQPSKTPQAGSDPWQSLRFLEGSWTAKAEGGTAGAETSGTYTFAMELKGHILARRTIAKGSCSGPRDFNCDHSDLLYVYQENADEPLKAIYFDNEGHVIHYSVTIPKPERVVFLSEATHPGPRFRLIYELKAGVMHGQFEMQMPGSSEWKAYLTWEGTKVATGARS